MMHDFGVTATRVVFLDLPVALRPRPGRRGPVAPLPLDARGRRPGRGHGPERRRTPTIRWIGIDPSLRVPRPQRLRRRRPRGDRRRPLRPVVRHRPRARPSPASTPALARWTVDLDAEPGPRAARSTTPRSSSPGSTTPWPGSPHRYGYCVRLGDRADAAGLRGPGPVRPRTRRVGPVRPRARAASPGSRCSCGRPTDGARTRAGSSSVVYDAARDASDLVILDATSFAGPPVATVHLPARVPFGFHGSWVPSDS